MKTLAFRALTNEPIGKQTRVQSNQSQGRVISGSFNFEFKNMHDSNLTVSGKKLTKQKRNSEPTSLWSSLVQKYLGGGLLSTAQWRVTWVWRSPEMVSGWRMTLGLSERKSIVESYNIGT